MPASPSLDDLRTKIREHYLIAEDELLPALIETAALSPQTRDYAQKNAADFVVMARANAERSGLIDKFLQEYGLSTREGVTLMRLAEALLRTPDAATADALIEDKIEAGDWASHKGKSPFPLINFSTRALMLTAAWLDDVEGDDPLHKMVGATKDILDRLGEPVIRASVAQAMRIMGEHFVLGETIDEAMKRGKKYAAKGYVFSFDMLGEAAHTAADAEKYFGDYENAIESIARHADKESVADNPGISVKLSALHPRYEFGKKERVLKELGGKVRALAVKAKNANMGFNIDAEEADRLDLSLDIIEQLMRDPDLEGWGGFGVVVQAYQRRASFVLDWLATLSRETGRRIMVRLVKGAYWDSEIKRAQVMGLESYPVFTRKVSTDLSFLACARKLLDNTDVFYPQFATHNALTAAMVREMAGNYSDYELQRLHGMGDALHDSLVEKGARSRIYAPVGGHKELLPYLVRRLLENGANSSFVNQLIDPDLSVDEVVADPIDEIAELDGFPNPHIPAPRDHLRGERLAAKGLDETHPPTAAEMSPRQRSILAAIDAVPIINGVVRSNKSQPVTNPADHTDTIGTVAPATNANIADACYASKEYAPAWGSTLPATRAAMLREAADLLEERREHFMALAVFEAGKSWPDAVAEVREAVDFLRYYADGAQKLSGTPLGVVTCISPWNFPLAIFLGQVSAALAAGNCVIAKPAEQTPLIAFEAVKLLHEAGVHVNALHYLPGDGPTVGAPLVEHPNVDGVVFTGSTQVAQSIKQTLIDCGKIDSVLIAETGGLNAMIVDSTALLEQAVTDVVDSAFQSAGQRCSACRIVCVQQDIAPRFKEMLTGAMNELRIGNPASLATDVGPLIDEEAREYVQMQTRRLERDAVLIACAEDIEPELNGSFFQPVAYEVGALNDIKKEIFAPVLHVVQYKAEDLDTLIDEINALGFGLTMGVHTRIDETMHAIARRARVGNLYVNRNQIGAVVGVQPFGGEGLSGTGPKAGGPHYLAGLTKKAITSSDNVASLRTVDISVQERRSLEKAISGYNQWSITDRAAIMAKVLSSPLNLSDAVIEELKNAAHSTNENIELPGPTGESNTLKLRGRGIALCLGGDGSAQVLQCLKALMVGNCVITEANNDMILLRYSLEAAGAPASVLTLLDEPASEKLLLENDIRLVAFDGNAGARHAVEKLLAERKGTILTILSGNDDAWRYATERTLTINTTAAGGDVRLLSLSE